MLLPSHPAAVPELAAYFGYLRADDEKTWCAKISSDGSSRIGKDSQNIPIITTLSSVEHVALLSIDCAI
jgi:hypothetical protein